MTGMDAVKVLKAEIAERERELARYKRALALLEGNGEAPRSVAGQIEQPRRGRPTGSKSRKTPSRVGPERMAIIEEAIRNYAADHEEFRQVDIRMNSQIDKSSVMALAFETLRQQGVIRFARREGSAKFYRLTESARRENDG